MTGLARWGWGWDGEVEGFSRGAGRKTLGWLGGVRIGGALWLQGLQGFSSLAMVPCHVQQASDAACHGRCTLRLPLQFPHRLDEIEELLSGNRIWKERTVDVGVVSAQMVGGAVT